MSIFASYRKSNKCRSRCYQIFDSWAGLISPEDLPNYCYIPNLKIVDFCKEKKIPVYVFQEELKKIIKNLIM